MNPINNIFIDEITELLTEVLPSSKDFIIWVTSTYMQITSMIWMLNFSVTLWKL